MATSFVQKTSNAVYGTSANLIQQTASFPSNVTSGNLIVVFVTTKTAVTVTITDQLGNTYTASPEGYVAYNTSYRLSAWYAISGSSGSNYITATFSGSPTEALITAGEWSGVATSSPIDSSSSDADTGASVTTGTVTVSGASGLVVGANARNAATFSAAGSPFTNRDGLANGALDFALQLADDAAATVSEAYTTSSGASTVAWAAIGLSFDPLAASPPPPVASTIYEPYRAGPPLRGMPWTTFIPRPRFEWMAYPASQPPPPPTPPIPIPPPPPPGVPPTYPPLPPAPDFEDVSDLVDIDKRIDPRLARVLEINSAIWNSLLRTGQVIRDPQSDNPLSWRIVAPTWGGLTGAYGLAGYYVSNIEVYQGLVQAITITPLPECDCDCCDGAVAPVDPFDPWSGAGAPSPTTVFPFMVTVLFRGAGGEAQTLNIVASPNNIVPGSLVGSTGLLGGGTVPTGVYNAPAGGTTLWGLYPGAWYVGFVTAATDDRFEMVDPVGTIENPDNAAWHDYVLINVNADGTVTTGVGGPTAGAFTVTALVPP